MKISVDENIPIISIDALRKMGHTVKDIRGTIDEGMTDDSIWEMTQNDKYLLITTDKGFAHYRTQQNHGILIIRLKQPNESKIHQRIIHAINQLEDREWKNLTVIMRDTVQSVWKA